MDMDMSMNPGRVGMAGGTLNSNVHEGSDRQSKGSDRATLQRASHGAMSPPRIPRANPPHERVRLCTT